MAQEKDDPSQPVATSSANAVTVEETESGHNGDNKFQKAIAAWRGMTGLLDDMPG